MFRSSPASGRSGLVFVFLVALGFLAHALPAAADIMPTERRTTWNPGIPGGIPARTTVCATVNASTYGNGTVDATAGIQAAINACPDGPGRPALGRELPDQRRQPDHHHQEHHPARHGARRDEAPEDEHAPPTRSS